jgi:hypothetical protein
MDNNKKAIDLLQQVNAYMNNPAITAHEVIHYLEGLEIDKFLSSLNEKPINPIHVRALELSEQLIAEISKRGYGSLSTCNTNSYGWKLNDHLAMEHLRNNQPLGYSLKCEYKHEVWDWTLTAN